MEAESQSKGSDRGCLGTMVEEATGWSQTNGIFQMIRFKRKRGAKDDWSLKPRSQRQRPYQ